jgi:hypothetical protein
MVPGRLPVCVRFSCGAGAAIAGVSGASVSCVGCIDRLGFSDACKSVLLRAGALGTYGASTFEGLVSVWAAYSCIPESHDPGVSV